MISPNLVTRPSCQVPNVCSQSTESGRWKTFGLRCSAQKAAGFPSGGGGPGDSSWRESEGEAGEAHGRPLRPGHRATFDLLPWSPRLIPMSQWLRMKLQRPCHLKMSLRATALSGQRCVLETGAHVVSEALCNRSATPRCTHAHAHPHPCGVWGAHLCWHCRKHFATPL